MLLAVNIGNSNIRFAVFKSDEEIVTWTINSKPYRTEYEFFAKFSNMYEPFGIKKEEIIGIVIGSVEVGRSADLVIFDMNESFEIDVFKSKSQNCPFKNYPLKGKVKYTICNGRIVYSDGKN